MSQNQISLARKYRPNNFTDLLEQDMLVKTLSFAIKNDKISQSYLLTGIRGIGKTTTARIIAKTINCEQLDISQEIPNPCNNCANCVAFFKNSHPDILEIDAASRTGVDDVRSIIESAEYKPLQGKFKIFIIDEVHMLSKNAFNALLKLIEEPPQHIVFILATTETHKIPLTIISRCQRFDLSRFSHSGLFNLIKKVANKEKFEYEEEAISLIATKSDGSARDALSLLEQALILSQANNYKISSEIVKKMVSAVDKITIIKYLTDIVENNCSKSLKVVEEFYLNNTDFVIFLKELMSLLSFIAKKHISKNYSQADLTAYNSEINNLIEKCDLEFTQIAWQHIFNTSIKLKDSLNQLELIEMLTINLNFIFNSSLSNSSGSSENINNFNIKNEESNNQVEFKKKFDNFEKFLNSLKDKKEFELFYEIFNNTNYEKSASKLLFKLKKPDRKFENQIYEALTDLYGKIEIEFSYEDDLLSKKQEMQNEFLQKPMIKDISKNFSDFKIVDILINEHKKELK